jgi:hypothetical protein
MHLGPHHQSKRREGIIQTARSETLVWAMDMLAYGVSFLSLAFTTNQLWIIWVDHIASGISVLAWIFYTLSGIVWFLYGLLHRDRVISITNFLWALFAFFIVIGVLIYG